MVFPLSLLQQLGGSGVPAPTDPVQGDPIVVTGRPAQPNVDLEGPEPPFMGNRQYLEEARMSLEDAPQRKGMFGTKGTLRDILGTLGDAFLVQSGNDRIYAPKRNQEQMSDALVGFTNSPDAALAAIERLADVNPQAAQELYNNLQASQARQMANDIDLLRAGTTAGKENDARYQQYARLFSQYAGSATPETYERMKPILETLRQRGGLGEEFDIPDQYDENLLRSYQFGGMPANQQVQVPFRERQLDISQQNADANTRRAARPPQGRATTEASELSRIRAKINRGEELSAGDAATWKRYIEGTPRSSGTGRRSVTPPPPSRLINGRTFSIPSGN